ncbi:phosphate transporter PHO1, partial [Tanacetum coccineum]
MVLEFKVELIESRLLDFSLASLEVIRREHWNYYRLENEHLNNVGKYRAVKTTPLPFYETDSNRRSIQRRVYNIPLLSHMEPITCDFLAGSFKTHEYQTCMSGKLYRELAYVISFAPHYWRAIQCARRWFDEGDVNHLANLGKYVPAMVAVAA